MTKYILFSNMAYKRTMPRYGTPIFSLHNYVFNNLNERTKLIQIGTATQTCKHHARFEVFTMELRTQVFWDVTACKLVYIHTRCQSSKFLQCQ